MQFWKANLKASRVKQKLSFFMRVYPLKVLYTNASITWVTYIKDANKIAAISWFPQSILISYSNSIT